MVKWRVESKKIIPQGLGFFKACGTCSFLRLCGFYSRSIVRITNQPGADLLRNLST